MKPSPSHVTLRRFALAASLMSAIVTVMPAFGGTPDCTSDHFTSGTHTLPSYDEAMAECKAQESAMTHPTSGAFELLRSCHDVGPRGNHGPWHHGRIAVDVIARNSGDRYTFEGLWMCKPIAEADFDGPSSH